MSKFRPQLRAVLQYFVGVIGIALLTSFVVHTGPKAVLRNVKLVGWGLLLVIGLSGLSHLLKAWALRLTLPRHVRYSLTRMFGLRLVSEAVGQLGFTGVLAGEAARVSLLGSDTPVESRILSVTLDRGLFIACGAITTVFGITAGLMLIPLSHKLRLYAAVFAFIFLGVLLVTALLVKNRWPVLSGPARVLGRVPWVGPWVRKKESLILSVEKNLLEFHRERPSAFWGGVALNFMCHALAIAEVYLILLFMGKNVTWTGSLILEAFTKVINLGGAVTPGNVGLYEGGTILIAGLFGLSGSVGLTLGLCRRVRSIFWSLVGVLSYFVVSRSAGQRHTAAGQSAVPENSSKSTCESSPGTMTAIIFADDEHDPGGFTPELAHVGTLPIVLRAILQAHGVDASRIIVASRGSAGNVIRRNLSRTGRLPGSVEWFEIGASPESLSGLLREIAAHSDRILLVSGCAAYHPSLFETIRQWDGHGEAVALTTNNGQFAGLAALSRQGALDISRDYRTNVATLTEFYDCFKRRTSVVLKPVQEHLWQSVVAPSDRLIAEQKLNGWLVKPTDGFYARMNRRISIPISRQIIKFPITPNMVTVFTLCVSFLAGVFFALGGYWNFLFGALLSVWASILDGCDGEVARLKLQASKFGCWLETICDYLYYLFIFAGMSLGLTKIRGTEAYLAWGGILLFGAVASFLAVSSARHRFAASQPEKFLDLWQKKAEQQITNPLMYLARNTEFIIRRCCLPYILLAFAILNLTRFFFIGSAVGANIAWMIALYSYSRLSRPSAAVTWPAGKNVGRQGLTGGVFDVGS
jgi:phosphatidylglycerophosphate synthase